METLDKPINIKIFFKVPPENARPMTYNHYNVIAKEKTGNWLLLLKDNKEEVLINLENVNQIITLEG
jgi:hypothetical protein